MLFRYSSLISIFHAVLFTSLNVVCFNAFATDLFPKRQVQIKLTGKTSWSPERTLGLKEMLDIAAEIPPIKIQTESPYEKGLHQFEGISVAQFVEKYGSPKVTSIKVKATDGYVQIITREIWNQYKVILAFKHKNAYMAVKSRGTFRIVYDFTGLTEIEKKKIAPTWVWTINEIEFVE